MKKWKHPIINLKNLHDTKVILAALFLMVESDAMFYFASFKDKLIVFEMV